MGVPSTEVYVFWQRKLSFPPSSTGPVLYVSMIGSEKRSEPVPIVCLNAILFHPTSPDEKVIAPIFLPERGIFARGVRGILVHVMLMRLQQRAATRHLRRSNEANMDITELYHFLFETPEGVGCLIGICLVLSLIVCVIMERRTRKRFADRPKGEDDWSIFDDDDEDEEKED